MDAVDIIFLNHKILSKQEKISLITLDNIDKIPFLRNAYELAKNENKFCCKNPITCHIYYRVS